MTHNGTIPRLLPASTLACPPSSTYIRQFLPANGAALTKQQPRDLASTAPVKPSDMVSGRDKTGTGRMDGKEI